MQTSTILRIGTYPPAVVPASRLVVGTYWIRNSQLDYEPHPERESDLSDAGADVIYPQVIRLNSFIRLPFEGWSRVHTTTPTGWRNVIGQRGSPPGR